MTTPKLAGLLIFASFLAACDASAPDAHPRLLFGLQAEDIEAAVDRYAPDADPAALIAQLQAPFDCERFGDACRRLGPEGTELALEEMWTMVRNDADPTAVVDAVTANFDRSLSQPEEFRIGAIPLSSSASETVVELCPGVPAGFLTTTVEASDLGLTVYGEVSYSKTRGIILGLSTFQVADPIDATMTLSIGTSSGASVHSSVTNTVAQSSATVGQTVFSSAAIHDVAGTVTTAACPDAAADVRVFGFSFPFPFP